MIPKLLSLHLTYLWKIVVLHQSSKSRRTLLPSSKGFHSNSFRPSLPSFGTLQWTVGKRRGRQDLRSHHLVTWNPACHGRHSVAVILGVINEESGAPSGAFMGKVPKQLTLVTVLLVWLPEASSNSLVLIISNIGGSVCGSPLWWIPSIWLCPWRNRPWLTRVGTLAIQDFMIAFQIKHYLIHLLHVVRPIVEQFFLNFWP